MKNAELLWLGGPVGMVPRKNEIFLGSKQIACKALGYLVTTIFWFYLLSIFGLWTPAQLTTVTTLTETIALKDVMVLTKSHGFNDNDLKEKQNIGREKLFKQFYI